MSALTAIRQTYLEDHPVDAVAFLDSLPDLELAEALSQIDGLRLVRTLECASTASARRIFTSLSRDQKVSALAALSTRVIMQITETISSAERDTLFAELPADLRRELIRLLEYPADTAGHLMDTQFATIRPTYAVADVLELVKQSSIERARSFFVVDNENRLAGRIDMQQLALVDPTTLIADIMVAAEGVVTALTNREDMVTQLNRFRLDSIPVIDAENKFMGVVRHQKLIEAIESVASADLQTMVGASADERALSSVQFAVRRRLPWLHINLLTAFLAASVVGLFESLIAQFTALAVLLPVVAGQSGNAGAQALAVTIRGLALREIGTRDWKRVLRKEMSIGILDGIALAFTCGLGVFLWSQSFGLALVIGIAMILSMISAGFAGALVPIVLTRVGQDPANASSIILTTVTDVAGFISFLGTATLLSFML